MSTTQASNPAVQSDGKSAKRKKVKSDNTNTSSSDVGATEEMKPAGAVPNGAEASAESPYLKELHK